MSNLRLQTGAIPDHILKLMPKEDRAPMGKAGLTFEEATEKGLLKLERDLHAQIVNELNRRGIYYVRSRMDQKTTTRKGVPDFLICHNGFIGLECKIGDNHCTEEQNWELDAIRKSGGRAYVVRSLQEVILILRK